MATEVLYVPEQHLQEVISVLRAGLKAIKVSESTRSSLTTWCNEEEEYLNDMGEEDEEDEPDARS